MTPSTLFNTFLITIGILVHPIGQRTDKVVEMDSKTLVAFSLFGSPLITHDIPEISEYDSPELSLGLAFIREDKFSDAIDLLSGPAKRGEPKAQSLYGTALIGTGQYWEAKEILTLALKNGERSIRNQLGIALAMVNELSEAERIYRETLLEDNTETIRFNLGLVLIKQKKIKEGMKYISPLVKTNKDASLRLGIVLTGIGYYKKSLHYLNSDANKNNPIAMLFLGICYMELDQEKKAETFLKRAATYNIPQAMHALGKLFIKQQRLPEALGALGKAYSQGYKQQVFDEYAQTLYLMDRQAEATVILHEAIGSGWLTPHAKDE